MNNLVLENGHEVGTQSSTVTLSFKLHTIILLVGPDCAGKTDFALEKLIPELKNLQTGNKKISIAHLDIDAISQGLVADVFIKKNDPKITQVSEQANDVLLNILKNMTSYPVNTDFVIVDANSLDPDFRAEVLKIGEENHYNVSALIFDLNDKKEYRSEDGREASPKQLKDLRRTLSGGISKNEYHSIQTIESKDFLRYEVVIEDYTSYDQYMLPQGPEYVIFGDIHGCLDEFIQLLKLNGFEIGDNNKVTHPEGKKVIIVGDIIDKGYAIFKLIEFIHDNLDTFYMVIGNHENFVVKALRGIIKKGDRPSEAVIYEYFNTYTLLNEPVLPKELKEPVKPEGEELRQKYEKASLEYSIHRKEDDEPVLNYDRFVNRLMERYEKSVIGYLEDKKEYDKLLIEYNNFLSLTQEEKNVRKIISEKLFAIYDSMKAFLIHRDFIITHAPCEKKYLGKISSDALRAARDYRYPKRRDFTDFNEFISEFDIRAEFLRTEARDMHPIHVYGHVMTKEVSRYKNKLAIDTGCVAGGKLSSVIIKNNKVSSQFISVIDDKKIHKTELYIFFEEIRDKN